MTHKKCDAVSRIAFLSLVSVFLCRPDELPEQGVCLVGTGLQLRMELDAHEPGVVQVFHDLHQLVIRRHAHQGQAAVGQGFPVVVVELIAVAVAFIDDLFAISFIGLGVLV